MVNQSPVSIPLPKERFCSCGTCVVEVVAGGGGSGQIAVNNARNSPDSKPASGSVFCVNKSGT